MEDLVKRFSREITLKQASAIALTAGTLSLHLLFLNSFFQFTVTVLVTSLLTTLHLKINGLIRYFIYVTPVLLALPFIPEFAASVFVISLFLLPSILSQKGLLLAAILAHMADVFSTFVSKGSLVEANPAMSIFMQQIGYLPALIISKTFLVFIPVYWACRNFDKDSSRFFLLLVFVTGLSMAFRNFLLYLA